ncbi:MAG: hypothetical protein J3K34DRAFT_443260 [Monoraphidium minutum]|nr:MAG: hypothetical protein J3K34DRAFT_443260 [Monoraphidium minutum]
MAIPHASRARPRLRRLAAAPAALVQYLSMERPAALNLVPRALQPVGFLPGFGPARLCDPAAAHAPPPPWCTCPAPPPPARDSPGCFHAALMQSCTPRAPAFLMHDTPSFFAEASKPPQPSSIPPQPAPPLGSAAAASAPAAPQQCVSPPLPVRQGCSRSMRHPPLPYITPPQGVTLKLQLSPP